MGIKCESLCRSAVLSYNGAVNLKCGSSYDDEGTDREVLANVLYFIAWSHAYSSHQMCKYCAID